jgi:phosphomannomutase
MNINPKIFRAYDVRGLYPKDINEDIFYVLAKVFAGCLKKDGTKIVVGQDLRFSSPPLAKAFIKGILDSGFDVLDIGQVTTPMLYFAVTHLNGAGGAMITASHNPLNYNGIKFVKEDSQSVSGSDIQKVYKEGSFKKSTPAQRGGRESVEMVSDYLSLLSKDFKIKRNVKIAVEADNSAAKLFLDDFLKRLRVDYIWGKQLNVDFSVSFDPDADRLEVFDENHARLRGDIAGGIIADTFLKKGDLILIDMVSSRIFEDYFKTKGIKVGRVPPGHYYIKKAMREKGAVFASEISGHYYFKSLNYIDSAFFALRMILESLDKNPGLKISELAKPFLKYFHSGVINLEISSQEQWKGILEKIKQQHKDGRQSFEDGILVEYSNWWFNLRLSNTEPVMRLAIEAKTKELMEEKKRELEALN